MPDNRPRFPEETDMNLSLADRRKVARTLAHGRKILLAKVVVSLKYSDERGLVRLEQLQTEFEGVVKSLPIWLRSERFLTKHLIGPAERRMNRAGILAVAKEMRGWGWDL
ncbi:hypothetical protein SEA_FIRECASTLE_38 [Microbacterium phage FireCastle]